MADEERSDELIVTKWIPAGPPMSFYVECRHCWRVYRSGWALRRAHRQRANDLYGRGMWRYRWRARVRRASQIRTCPDCCHPLRETDR